MNGHGIGSAVVWYGKYLGAFYYSYASMGPGYETYYQPVKLPRKEGERVAEGRGRRRELYVSTYFSPGNAYDNTMGRECP